MNAISVNSVTKSFDGKVNVLHNINFEISEGEVCGFLGPNGAGKTTTIRLLNGVLLPTNGKLSIFDKDVSLHIKDLHKICGVMTETANCYDNLTGEDNLLFYGSLYGLNYEDCKKRIDTVTKLFDINHDLKRKVREYSTGMKKKLSLSRAILHDPRVLFLDEPTSGLDPEAAKNVNDLIKNVAKEEKVTVFLCTHQLKYAEDICSLYGFIKKGKLMAFGTFKELIQKKNAKLNLHLRGENFPSDINFENLNNGWKKTNISSDTDASAIINKIINFGGNIFEAKQVSWNLEDLYFAYDKTYEKDLYINY